MKTVLSLSLMVLALNSFASVTGFVNVATSIDSSREHMTLSLKNITSNDVFCSKIVSRVIYEDPEKYLAQEEIIFTHNNLFVRGGYDKKDVNINFGKDLTVQARKRVPLAIINRVEVVLEESDCTPADFYKYCEFLIKTPAEQDFLEVLAQEYERYNCEEIAQKVEKDLELKLEGKGLKSLRGLRYFSKLHILDLRDNRIKDIQELRLVEKLNNLNLSANPLDSSFDLRGFSSLKKLMLSGSGVKKVVNREHAPKLKKIEL